MVYIIYERLKGAESFYHPYFEMVDYTQPTCYWPDEVIEKCDFKQFKYNIKYAKEQSEETWEKLQNFFSIYPDYFDPERTDKGMYLWACSFLYTRCFGWGLPSTMVVPLADCLNHSNKSMVSFNLLEKNLHKSMNKIYLYRH